MSRPIVDRIRSFAPGDLQPLANQAGSGPHEIFHVQIDDRGHEEGHKLRHQQTADDGDPKRLTQFCAGAAADRNRQRAHDHLQIVVADPAADAQAVSYAVFSQQTLRVSDLATKHALILAGAGWGHLPLWLVAADIGEGRLCEVPLAARNGLPGPLLPLYTIRRIDRVRGPAMESLRRLMIAHFGGQPQATSALP